MFPYDVYDVVFSDKSVLCFALLSFPPLLLMEVGRV